MPPPHQLPPTPPSFSGEAHRATTPPPPSSLVLHSSLDQPSTAPLAASPATRSDARRQEITGSRARELDDLPLPQLLEEVRIQSRRESRWWRHHELSGEGAGSTTGSLPAPTSRIVARPLEAMPCPAPSRSSIAIDLCCCKLLTADPARISPALLASPTTTTLPSWVKVHASPDMQLTSTRCGSTRVAVQCS
ncbi:hypothetical protein VPH35_072399 [Triticum aestivum]